jgi:hypothetical protein
MSTRMFEACRELKYIQKKNCASSWSFTRIIPRWQHGQQNIKKEKHHLLYSWMLSSARCSLAALIWHSESLNNEATSVGQGNSWKPDSFWTLKYIRRLVWILTFHYRVHNIHFELRSHSRLSFRAKLGLSSRISDVNCEWIRKSPCVLHVHSFKLSSISSP